MADNANPVRETVTDKSGEIWEVRNSSAAGEPAQLRIPGNHMAFRNSRLTTRRELRIIIPHLLSTEVPKYLILNPSVGMMEPTEFWQLQGVHNQHALEALNNYHKILPIAYQLLGVLYKLD
jgi:hypothetical protein